MKKDDARRPEFVFVFVRVIQRFIWFRKEFGKWKRLEAYFSMFQSIDQKTKSGLTHSKPGTKVTGMGSTDANVQKMCMLGKKGMFFEQCIPYSCLVSCSK